MSKDISRKMSVDSSAEPEDEPKKVKRPREPTTNKEIIEIVTRCEEHFESLSKEFGKIKNFLASGSFSEIKVKKQKVVRDPQPMSGYQYFLKSFREQHKELDNKTIFKDGAKEWQSLSEEDHEKYKQLAKDVFYKEHPDAERKPEKKSTTKTKKPTEEAAKAVPVPILSKPITPTKPIQDSSPVKSEKKKHHKHKHRESVSSDGDVKTEKKKKHHKKEKSSKVDEDAPTESE